MRAFTYQTNLYTTLQNLNFKLEQWQVEVESIERKVKRLKSEAIFLGILDLEIENGRWKEENVRGDEVNRTSASKLFSKIENP